MCPDPRDQCSRHPGRVRSADRRDSAPTHMRAFVNASTAFTGSTKASAQSAAPDQRTVLIAASDTVWRMDIDTQRLTALFYLRNVF